MTNRQGHTTTETTEFRHPKRGTVASSCSANFTHSQWGRCTDSGKRATYSKPRNTVLRELRNAHAKNHCTHRANRFVQSQSPGLSRFPVCVSMNHGGLQAEVQNLRGKTKTSLARAWLLFQRAASVHTRDDGGGHFLFPNSASAAHSLALSSLTARGPFQNYTTPLPARHYHQTNYVIHKHTTQLPQVRSPSPTPHTSHNSSLAPRQSQKRAIERQRLLRRAVLAGLAGGLLLLLSGSPALHTQSTTTTTTLPKKLKIPYQNVKPQQRAETWLAVLLLLLLLL